MTRAHDRLSYSLGVTVGTPLTTATVAHAGHAPPEFAETAPQAPAPGMPALEPLPLGDLAYGVPTSLAARSAAAAGLVAPDVVDAGLASLTGGDSPSEHDGSADAAVELSTAIAVWAIGVATDHYGAPPQSVAVAHPDTWSGADARLLAAALADTGLDVRVVSRADAVEAATEAGIRFDESEAEAAADVGTAVISVTDPQPTPPTGAPWEALVEAAPIAALPDTRPLDTLDALDATQVLVPVSDAAGNAETLRPRSAARRAERRSRGPRHGRKRLVGWSAALAGAVTATTLLLVGVNAAAPGADADPAGVRDGGGKVTTGTPRPTSETPPGPSSPAQQDVTTPPSAVAETPAPAPRQDPPSGSSGPAGPGPGDSPSPSESQGNPAPRPGQGSGGTGSSPSPTPSSPGGSETENPTPDPEETATPGETATPSPTPSTPPPKK